MRPKHVGGIAASIVLGVIVTWLLGGFDGAGRASRAEMIEALTKIETSRIEILSTQTIERATKALENIKMQAALLELTPRMEILEKRAADGAANPVKLLTEHNKNGTERTSATSVYEKWIQFQDLLTQTTTPITDLSKLQRELKSYDTLKSSIMAESINGREITARILGVIAAAIGIFILMIGCAAGGPM